MFACVWLLLLPLNLISASVGVLLWVWVALLSPHELLYGFMTALPYNRIVAVITIGLLFIGKERKDPYFEPTLFLLILFGLAATVSWSTSIVSNPTSDSLYEKLIKEIVLVFVITAAMTTRAHIDRLVLVVALSLGFFAVREGLIFLLTAGGHQIVGSGALGDNNGLAAALLMVIPLLSYLARHSVLRIVKIGMLLVLGLSVTTTVATYSRGGLIGLMVLAIFMVKNSRRKLSSLVMVIFAAGLLYVVAPDSWFSRINTINNASEDTSFMDRVMAWKMSLLIGMDNPLFGGGMHAVQDAYIWEMYKPYFSQVDFVDTPSPGDAPRAAHSIYFEVLGDLGFVGLALFLAILGRTLWNCRWLYRTCRDHAALGWAADLGRMLQISLAVYLATGALLSNGYYEQLYILIALVSRCRRTVQCTLVAAQKMGQPDLG
jgi:probable O-glycosylation ligase (exosortase A-associated)